MDKLKPNSCPFSIDMIDGTFSAYYMPRNYLFIQYDNPAKGIHEMANFSLSREGKVSTVKGLRWYDNAIHSGSGSYPSPPVLIHRNIGAIADSLAKAFPDIPSVDDLARWLYMFSRKSFYPQYFPPKFPGGFRF